MKTLMMINPSKDKEEPVNDKLTKMAVKVLDKCTKGEDYEGFYTCFCGKDSSNTEYFTKSGSKTNSLLVHYVKYHRDEISTKEIKKLKQEYRFLQLSKKEQKEYLKKKANLLKKKKQDKIARKEALVCTYLLEVGEIGIS